MSRVYEYYLQLEEQMAEFDAIIEEQQELAMIEMLDNYDDFINDEELMEVHNVR